MLFLRRVYFAWLLCLSVTAFVFGTAVHAETGSNSNIVTVSIPEVCRYRVDDSVAYSINSSEVIEETTISVLSNSRREWRLAAVLDGASAIEWSLDKENWYRLASRSSVILSGTKTYWSNYHIYFRFQKGAESLGTPQIQYQIFYES